MRYLTVLATPVLLAEQKQNVYLRASLTGLPFKQQKRVPISEGVRPLRVLGRDAQILAQHLECNVVG
ncbi:hypothetical protein [Candidatus Marithrix sp. Canyon 246]|uniref:hypothetical protein n=1 Tax=Candidatus Marithrix sp. Canyon 246 TaxID=1827136 RepID=UPI00084A03B2|nr:hypothetical protein [Candidatus Marithrix sp. Canyon 246]